MPWLALFGLARVAVSGLIGLLIVYAVMSWVQARSPLADVIARLCEPILRPFRRIIPLVGGIDLSPLVADKALSEHAREVVRIAAEELDKLGAGKVRVNKAGCLDRCAGGPIAVVYPEGVWYSYVDESDIDEIVQSHLKDGVVVQRLVTPPDVGR